MALRRPLRRALTPTTYTGFASAFGDTVLIPATEAEFHWIRAECAAVSFSTYTIGSLPDGWLCSKRISQYSLFGQPTEQADGAGTVQSTLLAANPALPLALFTNASLANGACAYLGFEAYEALTGWDVTGAQIVTGDAPILDKTAWACRQVASLPRPASPSPRRTPTLPICWKLLGTDLGRFCGRGWSRGSRSPCPVDGVHTATLQSMFNNTSGEWVYQTLGVPPDRRDEQACRWRPAASRFSNQQRRADR